MKKFLNFEEYNAILLAINTSTDFVVYGKDRKKDFYNNLFEKLFTISESDLLQKESINHPISKS